MTRFVPTGKPDPDYPNDRNAIDADRVVSTGLRQTSWEQHWEDGEPSDVAWVVTLTLDVPKFHPAGPSSMDQRQMVFMSLADAQDFIARIEDDA